MSALDDIQNNITAILNEENRPGNSFPLPQRLVKALSDFNEVAEYMKDFPANAGLNIDDFEDHRQEIIIKLWEPLSKTVEGYKTPLIRPKIHEAEQALAKFVAKNTNIFTPDPDILLRIENRGVARRYPYTNTFFISIPNVDSIAQNTPDQPDWQSSLAHELGHYIYWNSNFNIIDGQKHAKDDGEPLFSKDIDEELKKLVLSDPLTPENEKATRETLSVTLSSWSEEIFADLIGVKLLRERYVTSSRNMAIKRITGDEEKEGGYLMDNDHPIPYLRPFITAEGLKIEENNPDRKLWGSFKSKLAAEFAKINQILNEDNFAPQIINLGTKQKIPIEPMTIGIPILQDAIKLVINSLTERINSTKPLTDIPLTGLKRFQTQLAEEIALSFPPIYEKGDWAGFWGRIKRRVRRIIQLK